MYTARFAVHTPVVTENPSPDKVSIVPRGVDPPGDMTPREP